MPEPIFEYYKDKAGKFRFRLKASNGEIITVSEAYQSKEEVVKAIAAIKDNAPKAKTTDLTLHDVARDVKDVKDMQIRQEKHARISYYWGLVLGGLLGVIGNFFASYWFMTTRDIVGLAVSGFLFVFVLIFLLYQARKYVDKNA